MQDTTELAMMSGQFDGERTSISTSLIARQPLSKRISMKRTFDFAVAIIALILLSILLVLVAACIKCSSRGPVFFKHARIGRNGHLFDCLKFRTMRVDSSQVLERYFAANPAAKAEWDRTQKLHDDPRVTALGKVLRKSSVDELPQLINILRGEMSLVGPRPIVQSEVVRYGTKIQEYCSVRPGLTGLWQVSGRSACDYEKRVAFDCEYVARRSFVLDILIILRTLPAVFAARGAY